MTSAALVRAPRPRCVPLLADVAHQEPPEVEVALDQVGMTEIEIPVQVREPGGALLRLPARADAFVSLDDPAVKGIHMSRLILTLQDCLSRHELGPRCVEEIVRGFVASHAATSAAAQVAIHFDYLIERPALRSANLGWRSYPLGIEAQLVGDSLRVELSARITYASTCPCSAALSRHHLRDRFLAAFDSAPRLDAQRVARWLDSAEGLTATPHSQRSLADVWVEVRPDDALSFAELVDRIEGAVVTPVQAAVKREDEQEFARLCGSNPMFCEDAARRIVGALAEDPRITGYDVRVEHQESLHPHNAVARVRSRSGPRGGA